MEMASLCCAAGDRRLTGGTPLRDIRALPKAHLHLHLTGSMRPATLQQFADAYQITLPPALRGPSVGWVGADRDWSVFQARYDAARNTIRSVNDLRRVVREAAEDEAADGSGWLELQVDPTSYASRFGGPAAVVEVLLEGCHDAAAATGVGTGPWHVRECVQLLGATRIGHGITAVHDQCVLDQSAARAVALEICPTSYEPMGVLESVRQLPITPLLDAGVPVAIGADDPLLLGTRLAGQYQILRDVLGFGDEQLAVLARHSITASAAPAAVKRRLLTGVDDWLA